MAGKMTSIWSRQYHLFANDKLVRQSGCRERERPSAEVKSTRRDTRNEFSRARFRFDRRTITGEKFFAMINIL